MMPQSHFVVAAVVTVFAIILFYPDLDLSEATVWVLVAGVVAAVIDIDVILMVRWKARTDPDLRPYTDMRVVAKDLRAMLRLLHRKGLLVKVAIPHLASGVVLTLASYYAAPSVFIPVFLGAWSHLLSDVPYVWSIMREA
jgi:hypothetical protein